MEDELYLLSLLNFIEFTEKSKLLQWITRLSQNSFRPTLWELGSLSNLSIILETTEMKPSEWILQWFQATGRAFMRK
jgi:hypothetical protein